MNLAMSTKHTTIALAIILHSISSYFVYIVFGDETYSPISLKERNAIINENFKWMTLSSTVGHMLLAQHPYNKEIGLTMLSQLKLYKSHVHFK